MPGWPRPTLDCHSGRPEEGPDHRMERHTWEPKTKIHPCLVTDSPKLQQLVQQVVKNTKFIIKSKIYWTTKTRPVVKKRLYKCTSRKINFYFLPTKGYKPVIYDTCNSEILLASSSEWSIPWKENLLRTYARGCAISWVSPYLMTHSCAPDQIVFFSLFGISRHLVVQNSSSSAPLLCTALTPESWWQRWSLFCGDRLVTRCGGGQGWHVNRSYHC